MRRAGGFSLIEAIVAIALLASGLLSLAHLLVAATASNLAARRITTATVLASEKAEELRWAPAVPTAGVESLLRGGGVFVRRWTAESLPGTAIGTVVIRVRVEPLGAARLPAARVTAATRAR